MKSLSIVASVTAFILLSAMPISSVWAARSCTERYNNCVSHCMTLGIGKSRRGGGITRPMPADVCHAHCIGWATECKKTGCFNGDLKQECGLIKH